MALKASQKQLQIDKNSQQIIIATSIAAFVVVFCLIAIHSLFGQMLYQNKIVSAKKTALAQLEENQQSVDTLKDSYSTFVQSPQNIIGGNITGTGSEDGDNAKIILDALPSKYDFPALATSLEKLLSLQGVAIDSISGTDDELMQGTAAGSGAPQAVAMPFQIKATGSYDAIQKVSQTFEASIRPIQVQTMTLTSGNGDLSITLSAQTFYQPEKVFTINKKTIN